MDNVDFGDLLDELLDGSSVDAGADAPTSVSPAMPSSGTVAAPTPAATPVALPVATPVAMPVATPVATTTPAPVATTPAATTTPAPVATTPAGPVFADPHLMALRNWLDQLPPPMQKALLLQCSRLYAVALEAKQRARP
jgi:hypothetical protein